MLLSESTLITVIVPCYNQAEFLPIALQSILNQSYSNWECIIVNDGSPDNTEEIAKHWCSIDPRFHYIKKENGGLSSARNAGILKSQGEFIQFLDADDLIEFNKLEIQSKILAINNHIDLVYSSVRYFTDKDKNARYHNIDLNFDEWQPKISGHNEIVFNELKKGNIYACNCPLLRKSKLNEVGLFNETLRSHEDYEYWIRMAIKGAFFHYDNSQSTFALVRVHYLSMSNNKEQMHISFLLAKFTLLKHINQNIIYSNQEIKSEIKNVKRSLATFFIDNKIELNDLKPVLNSIEKKKIKILKFIPRKLKLPFLFFSFLYIVGITKRVLSKTYA